SDTSTLGVVNTTHTPFHDGIVAGTFYNAASRKLILSFKHGRRIALSPLLARLIAARLPELDGDWLFIPVPLHPFRLWKRGFNQAALLARDVARLRRQRLLVDGLRRRKYTRSLGGLGRQERERTLANAIVVNPRHSKTIDGANVVLIDDVLTSGATSDSCVGTLKRAGARTVMVACFARVST
ncbi:MAG: ComF family protein, partial [Pontixanthobacter sp.]